MSPVMTKTERRNGSRRALGVATTAEETLAALRAAHADGTPVPVTALPLARYAAVLQHFGSIIAARDRLGLAPLDRPRRWSRNKVLAELRRLFRNGVEPTVKSLCHHRGLIGAISNDVGGLRAARALAGLPEPERQATTRTNAWDDLEVVRVIEQRARNGEPLAASQVPSTLYTAARKHWGSWARAIEPAGLDYASIRRRVRTAWTKAEIIAELPQTRAAHPAMSRSELSLSGLGQARVNELGSLAKAVQAVGAGARIRPHVHRTREDVVNELRRLGRGGRYVPIHRAGRALASAAFKHFGSWRAPAKPRAWKQAPPGGTRHAAAEGQCPRAISLGARARWCTRVGRRLTGRWGSGDQTSRSASMCFRSRPWFRHCAEEVISCSHRTSDDGRPYLGCVCDCQAWARIGMVPPMREGEAGAVQIERSMSGMPVGLRRGPAARAAG